VNHVFKPISVQVDGPKILYWEIYVIEERKGRGNGMGFMIKNADLTQHMPGWERGTYAMHSDDGHAYYNNDSTIYNCKSFAFGPAYQDSGIIIGCGYNFSTREIFFTHNGLMIGVAFVIPNPLEVGEIFPCVGMSTPRSLWRVNLGQRPFAFNIDCYICGENVEILNGLTFDESEAGSNHYRVSRKDTIEKIQKGENFLQAFIPEQNNIPPTQPIRNEEGMDMTEESEEDSEESEEDSEDN